MTEYVKRDLLIQLFNDAYDRLQERIDWAAENEMWTIRHGYKVCRTQLEEDIGIVKSVDAADVRPVVRGEWVYDCERVMSDGWTYRQRHCSRCGFQTVECVNFCQNCGADMRTPEKEE